MVEATITPGPPLTTERRAASRYPIRADVAFRLVVGRRVIRTGTGSLLNISRSGLLFESARPIPPGGRIELVVDWPSHSGTMALHVAGETVRSQGGRTAVKIRRSAFRAEREAGRSGAASP